jgi:hypothetical protein
MTSAKPRDRFDEQTRNSSLKRYKKIQATGNKEQESGLRTTAACGREARHSDPSAGYR